MKRCELLSPAGNMEMLKYAIQYGADAVYLAGTRFGARKFANNFTDEELEKAVKYAHLRGVKVYVTINTLVYEDEVNSFVENVKFIHRLGVDAVLVQDFGMINIIRQITPNLEVHASTQFHTGGQSTIDLLAELGVKRVVLDREMTLDEIKNLTKDVEIEVFIHGALCVSYSGQCLFSSRVLERSGNRGECAGLCRLPYKIKDGTKIDKNSAYYLSLKDFCGSDSIYELIDCGVSSLKIEGRMKSPEYVGYLTKIYRSLIDSYYEGTKKKLTTEELENIRILFNRGLTKGFLREENNEDIVNLSSPNHIGIHLGTYKVIKDKVEIALAHTLDQGDTIRFKEDDKGMMVNFLYDTKNKLINSSLAGQVVYVDNFLGLEQSGEVRLVASTRLTREIADLPDRKISIVMNFTARQDRPITLEVIYENHNIIVQGSTPEIAQSRAVTEQDVVHQLTKTGNTTYQVAELNTILDDNLFINLKDLNDLRRSALSKLDEELSTPPEAKIFDYSEVTFTNRPCTPKLLIQVETLEQYEVAQKYTDLIFTSNSSLQKKITDVLPKYTSCKDEPATERFMVADYGLLTKTSHSNGVYSDYMMNVTNSHTANALLEKGISVITLSVELKDDVLDLFAKHTDMSKMAILVYGKIELMKMKYNPIKERGTHLVDRNGASYRIKKDDNFVYLMSSKPIDKSENTDTYISLGAGYLRLDFTDETKEECEIIVEKFHKIKKQE